MIICTDNYVVRNFTVEDTRAFYELTHESLVKKYVPYAYCENYEMAEELIGYYVKGDCVNDFYLAIVKDEKIIGSIIANKMYDNALEVSAIVSSEHRNKGVMTETMNGFIKWLEQNTSYQKIRLVVEKENIASIKQVEKMKGELYNDNDLRNFYQILIR